MQRAALQLFRQRWLVHPLPAASHAPTRGNRVLRRFCAAHDYDPSSPSFSPLAHQDDDDMSTASSGKRKRSSGPAFYAVKVGRTPGIYHSWDDTKRQTDGVKAVYRKFDTLTEAEAFIKGTPTTAPTATSSSSSSTKPAKHKFYGVAVGHVPGVYSDWASVQAQTKGCAGAKQKAFATRDEALAWVNAHKRDPSVPISLRGDLSEVSSATGLGCKVGDHTPKRLKKTDTVDTPALPNGDIEYEPGMGPLPPGAEDNFDRTITMDIETGAIRHKTEAELNATKRLPTGDFSGPIVVYTDGSSLGNGQVGAVAGVGVYFGPNDARNVSEALRGSKQTNQRAELTAVARALDHVPIDRDVQIYTDSYYSIRCLTEWSPKWMRNNWKNSAGKDVENRDLVEPIVSRICEREACRAKTKFQWIKGHANDPGNVAADQLAVNGSRFSTPELRGAVEFSVTLRSPIKTKEEWVMEKQNEKEDQEYDAIFSSLPAEQPAAKSTPIPDSDLAMEQIRNEAASRS